MRWYTRVHAAVNITLPWLRSTQVTNVALLINAILRSARSAFLTSRAPIQHPPDAASPLPKATYKEMQQLWQGDVRPVEA